MKWLKEKYSQIPRPTRTSIQLGLLPVIVLAIYVLMGMPMFSEIAALRQAEKANLVGPGRILGTVTDEKHPNIYIVVAEDDHGYILCRYAHLSLFDPLQLVYREKDDGMMLLGCPVVLIDRDDISLPVLLFCNDPKATQAEVDLSITIAYDEGKLTFDYPLTASRVNEDYFEFYIDTPQTEAEAKALYTFAKVSMPVYGSPYSPDVYDIRATVRLYADDELYRTEELTVDSVADDAYERFGTP